jgi:hypothetical protein
VTTLRLLDINVGADYVAGYGARVDNIGRVRADAKASVVVTTESGPEFDAELLSREFGWRSAFARRGGSNPISTAVHWDPDKYKFVRAWQFTTLPTSTHRWGTCVKLRHISSADEFYVGATHCIPWPKGPNNIRRYNEQREAELGSMLRQVRDLAAGKPAVVAGDFNGLRTDTRYPGGDGPGKAMNKHGFTEAKPSKAIIDRVCGRGVTFTKPVILPTRGATDHDYCVAVDVTLP